MLPSHTGRPGTEDVAALALVPPTTPRLLPRSVPRLPAEPVPPARCSLRSGPGTEGPSCDEDGHGVLGKDAHTSTCTKV